MSRFSKVNLSNTLKLLKNIQMDKRKVYQKIYQLPELPETLWFQEPPKFLEAFKIAKIY